MVGDGTGTSILSAIGVDFALYTPPVEPPDLTILWLLLIVFLITIALGFLIPGVHILCGVVGLFLAVQVFSETASVALAGIIAGVSLLVIIAAMARLRE
jgi:hypothetical protein